MITYAKESYNRLYSAPVVSIASLLCCLIYIGIILIPFFLAFATNSN